MLLIIIISSHHSFSGKHYVYPKIKNDITKIAREQRDENTSIIQKMSYTFLYTFKIFRTVGNSPRAKPEDGNKSGAVFTNAEDAPYVASNIPARNCSLVRKLLETRRMNGTELFKGRWWGFNAILSNDMPRCAQHSFSNRDLIISNGLDLHNM